MCPEGDGASLDTPPPATFLACVFSSQLAFFSSQAAPAPAWVLLQETEG